MEVSTAKSCPPTLPFRQPTKLLPNGISPFQRKTRIDPKKSFAQAVSQSHITTRNKSSALPRNSLLIKPLFPINPMTESHITVTHGGASLVPVSPLVVETPLTTNLKTPMTTHKYPPLSPLSSLAESLNEVTPDWVSPDPETPSEDTP